MKYLIAGGLRDLLIEYLNEQPYRAVSNIIRGLESAEEFDKNAFRADLVRELAEIRIRNEQQREFDKSWTPECAVVRPTKVTHQEGG